MGQNGIAQLRVLAERHNGKCLSKTYVNNHTKLRWRCEKGHTWSARPKEIKRGAWCPTCWADRCGKSRRKNILDIRATIEKRGGKLLTTVYTNSKTNLAVVCGEGHEWITNWAKLQVGRWCPQCYTLMRGASQRFSIGHLEKVANERGGHCLSTEYKNVKSKIRWKCAEGHEWSSAASNVLSGTWCPKCGGGFGEEYVRIFLEKLFASEFPKSRNIPWLKDKNGTLLELDGYCEKLNIGFEHHGDYHFEEKQYFHKDKSLQDVKARDRLKLRLCKRHKVRLFIVPEINKFTKIAALPTVIERQARALGIGLKKSPFNLRVNFASAYQKGRLKDLKNLAKSRKGKLLSQTYLGNQTRHEWQCAKGHTWWAVPNSIKEGKNRKGSWCIQCAGLAKKSLEDAQNLAKKKNGHCLAVTMTNTHTSILWRCNKGHKWPATYAHIKHSNSWCPTCAGNNRSSIEGVCLDAAELGVILISKNYKNTHTKLNWLCAQGHQFSATPKNVLRSNSLCPECYQINKGLFRTAKRCDPTKIEQVVLKLGFKLLNMPKRPFSILKKLSFRCQKKHTFKSCASHLVRGGGCPECAKSLNWRTRK